MRRALEPRILLHPKPYGEAPLTMRVGAAHRVHDVCPAAARTPGGGASANGGVRWCKGRGILCVMLRVCTPRPCTGVDETDLCARLSERWGRYPADANGVRRHRVHLLGDAHVSGSPRPLVSSTSARAQADPLQSALRSWSKT